MYRYFIIFLTLLSVCSFSFADWTEVEKAEILDRLENIENETSTSDNSLALISADTASLSVIEDLCDKIVFFIYAIAILCCMIFASWIMRMVSLWKNQRSIW